MKKVGHPPYEEITFSCSCGSRFETSSTLCQPTLHIEVCSRCHPFYTGTQKLAHVSGRVDRFKQKYGHRTGLPKTASTPT